MVDEEHKQEHNGMAKKQHYAVPLSLYIYPFGT